jgi:diguanylate cyclase (GGDEF)-like protein
MVAALLIRVDDFRQGNDTLGAAAGDAVLREVAQRLAGCVRKADTLARASADGFAVVVTDLKDEADCRVVAEKLLQALAAEFRAGGRRLRLAASIGISLYPDDAGDGEALLRNADAAMYRACQVGRNRIHFFGQ